MKNYPRGLLLETFEEVCRKTRSEHRLSRVEAAWQLGELYPNEDELLSLLHPLLADGDGEVRGTAAEALGKIGAFQRNAIPVLAEMLEGKDETDFNARVAYALGRAGKKASAAVPRLISSIWDVDSHASWAAVWALGEIAAPAKQVVSQLMRVVGQRDASHRLVALWALQRIGRAVQAAIPLVKACLSDSHPIVRFQAARTLGEIEPTWKKTDGQSPLFSDLPQDGFTAGASEDSAAKSKDAKNMDLGVRAIEDIGEIGPSGFKQIPVLVGLLHNQEPEIQGTAAEALGKIGYGSSVAVSELLGVLGRKDCPVRARVAWALGWTGQGGTEVAEQLARFMDEVQGVTHSEIEARWAALWSFGQVADEGERKVETIMSMLSDVESDLRFLAAECLGSIPADAKPALPHLWQAAHDLHATVRNRALWALSKIEGWSDPGQASYGWTARGRL